MKVLRGAAGLLALVSVPAALTDFIVILAYFVMVLLIPFSLLFMIVLSQTIARLIQIGAEKKWKNIISKIFTFISIIFQLMLCGCLVFDICKIMIVNKILLIIALILNLYCTVIFIKKVIEKREIGDEIILVNEEKEV